MAGIPNITFDYDRDADVLYISFGTGEPSYCENLDDVVMIELGVYSKLPTGLRILDVAHHGINSVQAAIQMVDSELPKRGEVVMRDRSAVLNALSNRIKNAHDLDSIAI